MGAIDRAFVLKTLHASTYRQDVSMQTDVLN